MFTVAPSEVLHNKMFAVSLLRGSETEHKPDHNHYVTVVGLISSESISLTYPRASEGAQSSNEADLDNVAKRSARVDASFAYSFLTDVCPCRLKRKTKRSRFVCNVHIFFLLFCSVQLCCLFTPPQTSENLLTSTGSVPAFPGSFVIEIMNIASVVNIIALIYLMFCCLKHDNKSKEVGW